MYAVRTCFFSWFAHFSKLHDHFFVYSNFRKQSQTTFISIFQIYSSYKLSHYSTPINLFNSGLIEMARASTQFIIQLYVWGHVKMCVCIFICQPACYPNGIYVNHGMPQFDWIRSRASLICCSMHVGIPLLVGGCIDLLVARTHRCRCWGIHEYCKFHQMIFIYYLVRSFSSCAD